MLADSAIFDSVRRGFRGESVSEFLRRLGIDPRQFWLLMDLFDELSERGELMDELGRNGVALRVLALLYGAITGLVGFFQALTQPSVAAYLSFCLMMTGFLVFAILNSEAGNSLLNPVDGLILAPQPINGATYTTAKLMHLARLLLYLVSAISVLPALAGLLIKDNSSWYPLVHLLAAFGAGILVALFCCALYGWLLRLVPASRLRAAGQLLATLPFLGMIWFNPAKSALGKVGLALPVNSIARWSLAVSFAAVAAAIVVLGLRTFSADYLIRITAIMQGHRVRTARPSQSRIGQLVGSVCGGPAARAGFAYVSHMARRDFQFRRQVFPMLAVALFMAIPPAYSARLTDPFSGAFTPAHLLPHVLAFILLVTCVFLPFGADFKAAWLFLLVPQRALRGFSRGICAALWIPGVLIPHVLLMLWFPWFWGIWHAALFVAYSAAICSAFLALELRIVDSIPFTKQVDPQRGAAMLPLMLIAGVTIGIAVGVQYILIFRSPAIAAASAAIIAVAAYILMRSSCSALEASMRHYLAQLANEAGGLYQEINL